MDSPIGSQWDVHSSDDEYGCADSLSRMSDLDLGPSRTRAFIEAKRQEEQMIPHRLSLEQMVSDPMFANHAKERPVRPWCSDRVKDWRPVVKVHERTHPTTLWDGAAIVETDASTHYGSSTKSSSFASSASRCTAIATPTIVPEETPLRQSLNRGIAPWERREMEQQKRDQRREQRCPPGSPLWHSMQSPPRQSPPSSPILPGLQSPLLTGLRSPLLRPMRTKAQRLLEEASKKKNQRLKSQGQEEEYFSAATTSASSSSRPQMEDQQPQPAAFLDGTSTTESSFQRLGRFAVVSPADEACARLHASRVDAAPALAHSHSPTSLLPSASTGLPTASSSSSSQGLERCHASTEQTPAPRSEAAKPAVRPNSKCSGALPLESGIPSTATAEDAVLALQRRLGILTFVSRAELEQAKREERTLSRCRSLPQLTGALETARNQVVWKFDPAPQRQRDMRSCFASSSSIDQEATARRSERQDLESTIGSCWSRSRSTDSIVTCCSSTDFALFSQQKSEYLSEQTPELTREKRIEVINGIYSKDQILLTENVAIHNRTTLMMRNIPNKYTNSLLLELFRSEDAMMKARNAQQPCRGLDFLYLPIDFRSKSNMGYAFLNFEQPNQAQAFLSHFQGFTCWRFNSTKCAEVLWSEPFQGLAGHIDRYKSSPIMHPSVPEEYKPMLFFGGQQIVFPTVPQAESSPLLRRCKKKKSGGNKNGNDLCE